MQDGYATIRRAVATRRRRGTGSADARPPRIGARECGGRPRPSGRRTRADLVLRRRRGPRRPSPEPGAAGRRAADSRTSRRFAGRRDGVAWRSLGGVPQRGRRGADQAGADHDDSLLRLVPSRRERDGGLAAANRRTGSRPAAADARVEQPRFVDATAGRRTPSRP